MPTISSGRCSQTPREVSQVSASHDEPLPEPTYDENMTNLRRAAMILATAAIRNLDKEEAAAVEADTIGEDESS